MSIADLQNYALRRDAGAQRPAMSKSAITTVGGRPFSTWLCTGLPAAGAAPTTAAAPTSATAGALGQNDSSGTQRILKIVFGWSATGGLITIADRLSHQGGLSGVTTGAQTTNLPTAALTRKTGGVGVMLGLEIYTAIGATGTTVTASYTNQGGTSGQTCPLTTWGGANNQTASRIATLPLAAGDTGVKAVASVTNTATTGTAGAFGVTLFYPLISFPIFGPAVTVEALFGLGSWFSQVDTGACLFGIVCCANTSTGVMVADIHIGED